MAIVTINGLDCGVTYTIVAGGTYNGSLVGPMSNHGNTTGICVSSIPNRNGDRGNDFVCIPKLTTPNHLNKRVRAPEIK